MTGIYIVLIGLNIIYFLKLDEPYFDIEIYKVVTDWNICQKIQKNNFESSSIE